MSESTASLATMSPAEKACYWNSLVTGPEPTIGSRLTVHTILLLEEVGIPSIPWGWGPLAFAGDNLGIPEVELAIHAKVIKRACNVLVANGLHVCEDASCLQWRVDRQETPGLLKTTHQYHFVTEFHFHIGPEMTLSLVPKEDILWWTPDLKLGDPDPQDPHLTLSTDPRLPARLPGGPSGPWSRQRAVKILRPSTFTEAVLLLLMKDIGSKPFPFHTPGRSPIDQLWNYMLMALSDSHRPETYHKELSPRFQKAWDYLCDKRPKGMNCWVPFFRLRYQMIKNSELPGDDFPYRDITKLKGGEAGYEGL